ncbi:IclR family transcriptional regulator [Rhizobiaceae bacterium]|nr:IclR family transcriptional regulator [Rhizobiaceae bacterium]
MYGTSNDLPPIKIANAEPVAIPTNLRLLAILEAVARANAPVTPTEVNVQMGLPKPTIHRLFATLEAEGFLQREIDGRSYAPGRRMNRLAVETVSAVRVRGARLAVMNGLAERIGETCNLAIPDRDAMIYLDRVETKWPLRIQLPVGTRVPLHATASGKMYLSTLEPARFARIVANVPLDAVTERTIVDRDALVAEIEVVRERGYATDSGEFVEGMVALAAPIADAQGHMFATLSFHAPESRMDLEGALTHLDALKAAATDLAGIVST